MIITDEAFSKTIHSSLKDEKKWVIGLSGGADSLCLTLLAHEYAKSNNIELTACFVDHKLRPESSSEILPIIEILKQNGIDYKVLVWEHQGDVEHNIQKKARDARYELLYKFCKSNESKVLLTAHHALDQWETFFMRLSKGSSLRGLACISPVSYNKEILLARPLLHFSPSDIKETLKESYGITNYVMDPSNEKTKYERTRWRQSYPDLSKKYHLDMENVNKSIERIQSANECLNEIAQENASQMFDGHYIDIKTFITRPKELKIRILHAIINQVLRRDSAIISYTLLETLAAKIVEKNFVASNICGLVFRRDKTKNVFVELERRLST